MKSILMLGAVAVAGGTFYFSSPYRAVDVYPVTPEEAYQRLRAVKPQPAGDGPFYRTEVVTSGTPNTQVRWTGSGSHSAIRCSVDILPEGEGSTRLAVSCGGNSPSSGAAASMGTGLIRKRVIEMVDAAMKDRPFDAERAKGSTAAMWPKDHKVHHADIFEASGKAIEMDAQRRAESRGQ